MPARLRDDGDNGHHPGQGHAAAEVADDSAHTPAAMRPVWLRTMTSVPFPMLTGADPLRCPWVAGPPSAR